MIKMLITYFPVGFIIFFIYAIVRMILKSNIQKKRNQISHGGTAKIDELMHNRNCGVPASCVVDSLKSEEIEYCGIEE